MTISDAIRYVGVNDTDIDLFESQYPVPNGVSYNSYLLLDDKIALLDTVDKRKYDDWATKVDAVLDGRTPDYIVVHHLEPPWCSVPKRWLCCPSFLTCRQAPRPCR